jgi:hypothetical protein
MGTHFINSQFLYRCDSTVSSMMFPLRSMRNRIEQNTDAQGMNVFLIVAVQATEASKPYRQFVSDVRANRNIDIDVTLPCLWASRGSIFTHWP